MLRNLLCVRGLQKYHAVAE